MKIGLEWFYRLMTEPRRLWKRLLEAQPGRFVVLFTSCSCSAGSNFQKRDKREARQTERECGCLRKILVAGAGGFIGGHLVKRLRLEGFWVRGVDLKRHDFVEPPANEFVVGIFAINSP